MQPCSVRGGGGGGEVDIDSCISIISYVAWLKSMQTHKAQISTHKGAASFSRNLLASVSFARNNFYMHTTEAHNLYVTTCRGSFVASGPRIQWHIHIKL